MNSLPNKSVIAHLCTVVFMGCSYTQRTELSEQKSINQILTDVMIGLLGEIPKIYPEYLDDCIVMSAAYAILGYSETPEQLIKRFARADVHMDLWITYSDATQRLLLSTEPFILACRAEDERKEVAVEYPQHLS